MNSVPKCRAKASSHNNHLSSTTITYFLLRPLNQAGIPLPFLPPPPLLSVSFPLPLSSTGFPPSSFAAAGGSGTGNSFAFATYCGLRVGTFLALSLAPSSQWKLTNTPPPKPNPLMRLFFSSLGIVWGGPLWVYTSLKGSSSAEIRPVT